MTVYEIDPTRDERWDEFVESHPDASVFHSRGWLEALRQTYGYEPAAFTTSIPGSPLTNAIPFCIVSGWLNGRRLVSLPFSDHSIPLVETPEQLTCLLTSMLDKAIRERWGYVEIRGTVPHGATAISSAVRQSFCLHKLDLNRSSDEIFRGFHTNCIKRKIRRAARERLTCEEGRSDLLIDKFYRLLLITRRRHGLPAQPIAWFHNLMASVGDNAKIYVASKDGRPIASILTLCHKQVLTYKYGVSDRKFSSLGGTHLLLWKAIQQAKHQRLSEFDMGRTEQDNIGLLAFKDRWGAKRTTLTYLCYPMGNSSCVARGGSLRTRFWSHMPHSVLRTAGRLLYKYMG